MTPISHPAELPTDWVGRPEQTNMRLNNPAALAANANVFLDGLLLFDVAKAITDQSHVEIEKTTINGRP